MGLLDRFRKTAEDVKAKAEDLAADHGDEAKAAIDKAADVASEKTDLDDKIDQGANAAKDAIDKLAGDDSAP
jgi:MT0933-like antitoxin protein